MKSSLNNDELAAIDALRNLTSKANDSKVGAEFVLKIPATNIISPSESGYNYDDDEDADDDEEDGDSSGNSDEDHDDEEEESDEHNSETISCNVSKNSSNVPIKNFEACIENTVKKIRLLCPEAIMNMLGSHFDEIIRRVCVRCITATSVFLQNIMIVPVHPYLQILSESIEKQSLYKIEILLKATVVYFLSLQTYIADELDSVDELLKDYSSHLLFLECHEDPAEAQYLLNFCNFIKKAIHIIPAKRNKMLLINICAFLEGSHRTYISGGTQSSATTRRTIIYEHESGLKRKCRPERRRKIPTGARKPRLNKEMITCSCGAYILKRTMWKHSRSSKHIKSTLSLPSMPSSIPVPAQLPDNGSESDQSPNSPANSSPTLTGPPIPISTLKDVSVPLASSSLSASSSSSSVDAPAAKRQRQSKPRRSMPAGDHPAYYSQPLPLRQPLNQMQMPTMLPKFSPLMHDMSQYVQPYLVHTGQQLATPQFVLQQPGYGYGAQPYTQLFVPMSMPPPAMGLNSTASPAMVGFVHFEARYVYPAHQGSIGAPWA
jgi:hypothetical protein